MSITKILIKRKATAKEQKVPQTTSYKTKSQPLTISGNITFLNSFTSKSQKVAHNLILMLLSLNPFQNLNINVFM